VVARRRTAAGEREQHREERAECGDPPSHRGTVAALLPI
jgi:hypothetical protein